MLRKRDRRLPAADVKFIDWSQILIQRYLNQLQDLRKVSGTHRESVVREAFKDLLKGWARSHDLIFVPEYEIETKAIVWWSPHLGGSEVDIDLVALLCYNET